MLLLEKELAQCEQCGATLDACTTDSGCLNCLLDAGLTEVGTESRLFQHYELCLRDDGTLDELGRGAMGVTYGARDLNLDSLVALKVISAAYSDRPEARERFRREARAAAQLRHPNVASVFHFGQTSEGQFFYAMELVEGETLEARVRREGPLGPDFALQVTEQVCRALIAAEGHRLVHRDLKPSNLMVVSHELDGTDALLVKVIDFGLAQAVVALQDRAGAIHSSFSGTPEFASPEQFNSSATSLDARSDIYSLGATLWYLLCGKAPFTGNALAGGRDQQQLHRQLPLEQLTIAKVPAPVAVLLRSMLATNPDARPQSARELLKAVRGCREAIEVRPRRIRKLTLAACVLALLALSAFGLTSYLSHRQPVSAVVPAPEKSIAVLPFENLSADKGNSYFATGVQDEILSDLAKVADLKVISRTSVLQYPGGAKRNLREIGRALGVAHVLEGSVQRVGNRARVNAQLIDTRTDAHLWAETYDRDEADVFGIQSEIAQKIADQLQVRISAPEKAAIALRPSKDLVAYNLYVEATTLIDENTHSEHNKQGKAYFHAVELLNHAIARDPAFFLAYCRLAEADDELYFQSFDRTSRRLELAKSAIDAAFRLRPDAGEAHLALATHFYHGYFDYDRARDELDLAARTLPNNARIFEWSALIDRRQNRWHDAVRNFNHAMELDPGNVSILRNAMTTNWLLRDYKKFRELFDRGLASDGNDVRSQIGRARLSLCEGGDTRALHAILGTIPQDDIRAAGDRFQLALYERDAGAAGRALAQLADANLVDLMGRPLAQFNRAYLEGLVARMKGDAAGAQAAFTKAREQPAERLREQSNDRAALCLLGLTDAALGQKEDALRESRRAVELAPVEKDALDAADAVYSYAVVCAWVGERDLAIEQLKASAKMPAGVSFAEIRFDPHWDPLRGDPRFDKIVASLAP